MRLEDLTTYEIIEHRRIEDLNSDSVILKHKKTGAKITLLSNDDDNNWMDNYGTYLWCFIIHHKEWRH